MPPATNKNLAIVGYGKMGKLVEQLAPQFGFDVKLRLDIADNAQGQGITADAFDGIDAAIEFSTPDTAPENLTKLAALRVPTVTGTTGWMNQLPRVTAAVDSNGAGLVWSPNFSVGVAVFRRLVAVAAELLSNEDA